MSDAQGLLYGLRDGVATRKRKAPERLNPLGVPLQRALRERLAQIRDDPAVRALVLTGAGKAFCVGADLSSTAPSDGRTRGAWIGDTMDEVSNPLIDDLCGLPIPFVVSVNGPAAGAGVGLALAADIVIAARSAYFYLPFVPKLGIIPDLGASWFLPRLVGHARSVGLSLLGDRLSAEEAQQWGLIWSCVDDAALPDATRETALRLAALPAHAMTETRSLFAASERHTLTEQLRFEAGRQRELADRDDFEEGVRAFLEKRMPSFTPR